MTTSDVINLITTVLAVLAAPIIALWVNGKLQRRESARQQKLQILSVLFSLRHQPLSPEMFRALNLLDAVFAGDSAVREAWTKYFTALHDNSLNTDQGFAIREEKRRDLMMEIIKALGLQKQISTSDLLRTYTPTTIAEIEHLAIWERIKRREDLRAEFIQRGLGFPDLQPA
jgi:hypothetical protein